MSHGVRATMERLIEGIQTRLSNGAYPNEAAVSLSILLPTLRGFPNARLERLLGHFEKYRLRNSDVPPDMLGDAYM
jgi:hypothetical protein